MFDLGRVFEREGAGSVLLCIGSVVGLVLFQLMLAFPIVGFSVMGFFIFSFTIGLLPFIVPLGLSRDRDTEYTFFNEWLLGTALYLAVSVSLAATPAMASLLGASSSAVAAASSVCVAGGAATAAGIAFSASGFGALAVVLAVGIYFGYKTLSPAIASYYKNSTIHYVPSLRFSRNNNKDVKTVSTANFMSPSYDNDPNKDSSKDSEISMKVT